MNVVFGVVQWMKSMSLFFCRFCILGLKVRFGSFVRGPELLHILAHEVSGLGAHRVRHLQCVEHVVALLQLLDQHGIRELCGKCCFRS